GDIEGALLSFNALPENLSNDVDIKILHSSLLLSAGKTKEAEIIAEELQAQNPNNVDVLELSMSVAAAFGNKTKTNALIKQLLSIDKNNVQANIQQAGMHTLNKKYKLAFNCYNAALQKDGNNVDALFGCGQSSYYLGKFSDAKKYLEKAISIDKTHSMSYAFLGKVYNDYENYKKASSYVQDAIKCDDSRPEFYTDLGFYLHKQNRLEEAEAALTKAIELEKDYFLAYSYRASLYKQQKQYMKALYDYYKVANTNSKYYYAYEEIGLLEWHENDFKRSRASFERALNNNPKSVSYKLMIAATYLKEKNLFEAKNFLQKAMKGVDRASIEYDMLRLYHDQGGANAESRMSMRIKTVAEPSAKGRMLFYLGLYYELKNMPRLAEEYFKQVTEMQTPLFFEYEIAEWSLQK
ncbi:MAG: tetratricopeptide repeat protein, partial [Treponema sp.]|nr:tetratricopeptide repeat protein [Treponema sp.]